MAAGNKVGHALASVGLLTDVDTTKRNPLGTRFIDDNANEYIYMQGIASLAAGDWCLYNAATASSPYIVARLLTTSVNGPVAVAMAAVLASQFGWFQVWGLTPTFTAVTTDGSADGKLLSQGATVGRLVTGSVTTKNIINAVAVGAAASNTGTVFITYPYALGTFTA